MNLKVPEKKLGFIKSFNNDEHLWKYIIALSGTVVDYFRSSLYSIITSVLISSFFLKLDSLVLTSKLILCLGVILLFLSAKYLTKISLSLKKLERNYLLEKRSKSLEDWIYDTTSDDVNKYGRHTRKATLFLCISLILFIASSLLNIKEKSNPDDKTIIQKVESFDKKMEEMKLINTTILQKLDSIKCNTSIPQIDTIIKKDKRGY